jgi:hypothetical protein
VRERDFRRAGVEMREPGGTMWTEVNVGPELRQVTPTGAGGRPRDLPSCPGAAVPARNPANDVRERTLATNGFLRTFFMVGGHAEDGHGRINSTPAFTCHVYSPR